VKSNPGKNNISGNNYILAYHHVERRILPTIARVLPDTFYWQLQYLETQGLYPCTLSNLVENIFPCRNSSQQTVALTFDDGFQCFYDYVYPYLEEKNFSATIFVITEYVGKRNSWDVNFGFKNIKHLDWQQIKELAARGYEIGSHTHRHYNLTQLDEKVLKFELDYSRKLIEDKIGKRVDFISYPFGRFNSKVLRSAKECGYQGGVTLNPFGVISKEDLFQLPRLGVYLWDTKLNFKSKFNKNLGGRIEKAKLQAINFFAMGTIIVNNFR